MKMDKEWRRSNVPLVAWTYDNSESSCLEKLSNLWDFQLRGSKRRFWSC